MGAFMRFGVPGPMLRKACGKGFKRSHTDQISKKGLFRPNHKSPLPKIGFARGTGPASQKDSRLLRLHFRSRASPSLQGPSCAHMFLNGEPGHTSALTQMGPRRNDSSNDKPKTDFKV